MLPDGPRAHSPTSHNPGPALPIHRPLSRTLWMGPSPCWRAGGGGRGLPTGREAPPTVPLAPAQWGSSGGGGCPVQAAAQGSGLGPRAGDWPAGVTHQNPPFLPLSLCCCCCFCLFRCRGLGPHSASCRLPSACGPALVPASCPQQVPHTQILSPRAWPHPYTGVGVWGTGPPLSSHPVMVQLALLHARPWGPHGPRLHGGYTPKGPVALHPTEVRTEPRHAVSSSQSPGLGQTWGAARYSEAVLHGDALWTHSQKTRGHPKPPLRPLPANTPQADRLEDGRRAWGQPPAPPQVHPQPALAVCFPLARAARGCAWRPGSPGREQRVS